MVVAITALITVAITRPIEVFTITADLGTTTIEVMAITDMVATMAMDIMVVAAASRFRLVFNAEARARATFRKKLLLKAKLKPGDVGLLALIVSAGLFLRALLLASQFAMTSNMTTGSMNEVALLEICTHKDNYLPAGEQLLTHSTALKCFGIYDLRRSEGDWHAKCN